MEIDRLTRDLDQVWSEVRIARKARDIPRVETLTATAVRLERTIARLRKGETYKVPTGATPCGRCGGYGGHHQWPGYTCFTCNGLGYV